MRYRTLSLGILYSSNKKAPAPEGYEANGRGLFKKILVDCGFREEKEVQTQCCKSDRMFCSQVKRQVSFVECVKCEGVNFPESKNQTMRR